MSCCSADERRASLAYFGSTPGLSQAHVPVLPWPDDQVPMIGHQAIGQEARLGPLDCLEEHPLLGFVIGVGLEDRQSGVRARGTHTRRQQRGAVVP
jgi:hypothetical protein